MKSPLYFLLFSIFISFFSWAEHMQQPKPRIIKRALYGYDIGDNSQVIVEISGLSRISVWMQDSRISSFPILIGMSANGYNLIEVQLPKPDFASEENAEELKNIVSFTQSENLNRNLKTDGLFVIPHSRNESFDRNSVTATGETLLIPLYTVLARQESGALDSVEFSITPEISKEFPYRRFQTRRTVEGHDLVNIIDSNDKGEAKSLTFLKFSNTVIYEAPEPWMDFEKFKGPISFLNETGHRRLIYAGHEILEVGNRIPHTYEPMALKNEKMPYMQNPNVNLDDSKIPNWNQIDLKYAPDDTDLDRRPTHFHIQEFLAKNGRSRQILTDAAYKKISSSSTAGESIATWTPHLKLQISSLGVMTYQDSPNLAPIFLEVVGDQEPIEVMKIENRLRVIFQDGHIREYNAQTGERLHFEKTAHRMCIFLFM